MPYTRPYRGQDRLYGTKNIMLARNLEGTPRSLMLNEKKTHSAKELASETGMVSQMIYDVANG